MVVVGTSAASASITPNLYILFISFLKDSLDFDQDTNLDRFGVPP